jgi:hypothetical protein
MSVTYSEILYSYTRHGIDIREEWFKDDKDMVAFIKSLKSVPKEELADIMSWNGIDISIISRASFQNKLFTSLFTEKVNDLSFKQQIALKTGDWRYLQDLFPEVTGLPRSDRLMTANEFPDDTNLYKPFFPEWDSIFYGLLPGDLIYIYSTPKMGKSVTAAYLAYKALANGYKVGFYNTELDTQTTQKAILGFNKGLKYNEALVFFQKHPKEYALLKDTFGLNLLMPPNLIFEWDLLEEMFKRCDLVILDNQVSALATLGIEESPQTMGDITRKLSTMQKKYGKPFIIVTQEAARQATPKELEVEPNILEYGTGSTRSSRACLQECSLALRIVKQNSHSLVRRLQVVMDRYRSKLDSMSSYEITINNRGEMLVEVMRDAIELALQRAEKEMMKTEAS